MARTAPPYSVHVHYEKFVKRICVSVTYLCNPFALCTAAFSRENVICTRKWASESTFSFRAWKKMWWGEESKIFFYKPWLRNCRGESGNSCARYFTAEGTCSDSVIFHTLSHLYSASGEGGGGRCVTESSRCFQTTISASLPCNPLIPSCRLHRESNESRTHFVYEVGGGVCSRHFATDIVIVCCSRSENRK